MGVQVMRVFYEPTTIMTAVAAGFQLIGGMAQASAAKGAAESEAGMLEAQAEQERKQRARDLSDLEADRSRTLARTRAVLAASGADASDPSGLAVLQSQAVQFGQQESRLTDDSLVRERSLEAKAANTRATGRAEATAQVFGGIGKAASAGKSLFAPTPAGKKK